MIVSICFTWFPIGSLGKLNIYHQSNIYHQLDFYTRTVNFTWRVSDLRRIKWRILGGVSDCEELVGVNWRVSDSVKNWWGLLTGGDGNDNCINSQSTR